MEREIIIICIAVPLFTACFVGFIPRAPPCPLYTRLYVNVWYTKRLFRGFVHLCSRHVSFNL